ncbi:MAG: ATP-binding protein [Planctomycetota bacterium]|nr:ATP-binding protein [Planctomycetota bacterium]
MAERQWMRLSVTSHPEYLEPLRNVVRETTVLSGLPTEKGEQVVLAVVEGWTNVIRHCYENCYNKPIDLEIEIDDENLTFRISDYGTFVEPHTMRGRDLEDVKPGGLGLHLMKKVMDEVRYEKNASGGTRLTLVKKLSPSEG